jgi:hypothetical protein
MKAIALKKYFLNVMRKLTSFYSGGEYHDLNLGLMTKARAWKNASRKCNRGITLTLSGVLESVRE